MGKSEELVMKDERCGCMGRGGSSCGLAIHGLLVFHRRALLFLFSPAVNNETGGERLGEHMVLMARQWFLHTKACRGRGEGGRKWAGGMGAGFEEGIPCRGAGA